MNPNTNGSSNKRFSLSPLRFFRGGSRNSNVVSNPPLTPTSAGPTNITGNPILNTSPTYGGFPTTYGGFPGSTTGPSYGGFPTTYGGFPGGSVASSLVGNVNSHSSIMNEINALQSTSTSSNGTNGSIVVEMKADNVSAPTPATVGFDARTQDINALQQEHSSLSHSVNAVSSAPTPGPSPAAVTSEVNTLQQERSLLGNAITDKPAPKSVNYPPTSNYSLQQQASSTLSQTKTFVSGNLAKSTSTASQSESAGWVAPKPEVSTPISQGSSVSKTNLERAAAHTTFSKNLGL